MYFGMHFEIVCTLDLFQPELMNMGQGLGGHQPSIPGSRGPPTSGPPMGSSYGPGIVIDILYPV